MLQGKSAIVTGSTSGIGLGMATGLARAGANVTINGLGDPTEIETTRAQLADETGVGVRYDGADMRKPDQIAGMVEAAGEAFGGVDIVVNNAGVQHVSPVEEFPLEKWDDILAINLSSAFHTIRTAVPMMKTKGWGRVINLASAHGLVASPFKAAYVSAKHGMLGLTKTVALEVAEVGITVNAICPGYVHTPLVDGQIDDTAKARGIPRESVIRDVMLEPQPTKRFIEVDEVAALTVFLCSDGAASITGASIPVDGGWTAR